MPFERVMGPNRHNMGNYGDLQPIAGSMKPTLWVPSENFSFGLLPNSLRNLQIALVTDFIRVIIITLHNFTE